MFCIKCGNEIRDDSEFCSKCGIKINAPNVVCSDIVGSADDINNSGINSASDGVIATKPMDFVFEAFRGWIVLVRGLGKRYRTEITCNQTSLRITTFHRKHEINTNTKKESIINRNQIVSVKTSTKIEFLPTIITLILLIATFVLSPLYIILAVLGMLSMFSKLIQIALSNGEKIKIRYSKNDPYKEFINYINKF